MSNLEAKIYIGSERYDSSVGKPIWTVNHINSAGGVGARIAYRNCSSKTIKYLSFIVAPYNSVGDIVGDEVSGEADKRVQITGPINPNKSGNALWDVIWYNPTIKGAKILQAEIQYMDGTEETIDGSQIGVKEGCYVATAVYGSYNCPQVWTLRRFRDYTLAKNWYGRAFIHTYYAISPTLVKWFGNTKWFRALWKKPLDKLVVNLTAHGVSDTPYEDRTW